jgi:putative transposase
MLLRLEELSRETCQQMECELLEFGGEDDHVHRMVVAHPKWAIANLVGKLKGKSAYFLRREFAKEIRKKLWGNPLWSPSYCVVSCGGAPLDTVRSYIENQRQPPTTKGVRQSISETRRRAKQKNIRGGRA